MSQQVVPLALYSDGPGLPTGLARITRDLASRLWAERESLGIDLMQVGFDPKPGLKVPWPTYTLGSMHSEGDWGAADVGECWNEWYEGREAGVLMTVWDPARCYSMLPLQSHERELWGYMPVDSTNCQGRIGGPAREAIDRYNRVLGYGRWAAGVLRQARSRSVPYLPHGLDLSVWKLGHSPEVLERAAQVLRLREDRWVLGCVATNQPRKDLGLYFGTLAELRKRGHKVQGWLHTDTLVRHWSVGQLAADFGLERHVAVSLSLSDEVLAACYGLCAVTFCPGLGEGFGYPGVESLACGTPAVSIDYAGGRELCPVNAWRVPARAWRLEGVYGLQRPVVDPVDAANAVERALEFKRQDEAVCQRYCAGSIQHLEWSILWPRWRSWFAQGLREFRDG